MRNKQVYDDGVNPTITTLYYAGGSYEIQDATSGTPEVIRYYSIAGQKVAMKDYSGVQYLISDHLGSTSMVLDDAGAILNEQRYMPFGEVRGDAGSISETDFGYTGQRALAGMGLMDYRYRFLSTGLGRFIQLDSIVPNPANPQNLNRFSYVNNRPMNYIDPSGHRPCDDPVCRQTSLDRIGKKIMETF